MRKLKLIVSFTFLMLFLSNGVFAQKANLKNSHLEFNNLKMDKTYRTVFGKVSQESRVARYIYNENFGPLAGTAEQMARQYLEENAVRFGIGNIQSQLQVAHTVTSPGGQHVTYNQYLKGIPVFRSEIVITINNENIVSFVASNFRPNLKVQTFSSSVSSSKAISIAKNYLNVTGKLLCEPKSELMIFDSKDKDAQLAFRVSVTTDSPRGDWEIFVNAQSGEIIHVKDRAMYQNKATGGGMAFDPDPLTTAGVYYGGQYVDNGDVDNDSLNNQRMNVTLQDLTFLNGTYKLEGPYCVLHDWESPSDVFPELADSTGFNYTRAQQEFEDVNVYYHIDLSYRWLMSMGYDIPGLYNFSCDPHGLNGDDNSWYVSATNHCAWGEGGVDDSEDAAVIWHEYGHAIQENIPPSMSYTGETESLQEGSSDYWAASYSRSLYDFGWGIVFIWDAGHTDATNIGSIWDGRHCDLEWVYPDNYVSGHDGGQIWSSALMKMWPELGRTVTDNLFIQAHYIWGSSPGLQDAAQAFIQADRDLFSGAHLSTIVNWFDFHGLVDATQFIPQITHTPLSDTEDIVGPYTVDVEIIPATAPLDTANLFVYWGLNGVFTDSSLLQSTAVINQYSADIPGTGSAASVNYFISVVDTADKLVTHPANAPVEYHSFYVGSDTIAPVVVHTPLRDQAYIRWPATVTAKVTDNLGIADVTVNYYVNSTGPPSSFQLTDMGDGNYSGMFDIDTNSVSIGDSIFYRITATDNSSNGNITNHPVAGFLQFNIIDALGVVLVIDDDPTTKAKIQDEKGTHIRDINKIPFGLSANLFTSHLNYLGYVVDTVDAATADPATWGNYDFIIWSSGVNGEPVSSTSHQNDLVSYVNNGSKLLIEGGEVGYDHQTGTFATNVLHIDDWVADNSAGSLNKILTNHPIAANLPQVINFTTQTTYFDIDALIIASDAYYVFDWTASSGNAGMIVYDDNSNPTSAQIVFFSFAVSSFTTLSEAEQLIEKVAAFLMTPESAAIGAITGNVDLTDTANDTGVVVYLSGLKNDTIVTDNSGDYSFTGLYNGMYSVTTGHLGYFPYSSTIDSIQVIDNTVGGNDFTFDQVVLDSVSGSVSLSDSIMNIYAEVRVIGENTVIDTTDDMGAFNIAGIMPGNINIIVLKDGYITAEIDTFLANDESDINVDFMLYPGTNNYIFDFETDDGGLLGSGSWQWGAPTSGPGSAYSGANVWATNLSGNYSDNEHSELVTPELDLAGFNDPKVKFAHWYSIETATAGRAWDGGNLKVSTDGGSTFDLIHPEGGYPDSVYASTTSNALAGQRVFSGVSNGWESAKFDLSDYANQSIVLKFDFGSDGSTTQAGWYVDSVFVYNIDTVVTKIGLDDGFDGVPKVFALEQNYPNPFNPVTTIRYQLPKAANVHLAVYNMLGQKVKTLVNDNQPAKYYSIQWNGLNEAGNKVSSGIYLYRIEARDPSTGSPKGQAGQRFIKTNKMLLLK